MPLAEHPNVVEHHLQIIFRQLLRRGDVVYDVGAHCGWLSVPLAQLVGPRGYVLSLEPSPRNLQRLRTVLSQWCPARAEIVAAAAYRRTGERVDLFENVFSATDSLYFKNEDSHPVAVPTIALDDLWESTQLEPSLIKMDIEGAEADALAGASRLIEKHRPTLILEFRPSERLSFDWLTERGYYAYNLRDYDRIEPSSSLADLGMVEDLLFIHGSRAEEERSRFLLHPPGPFEAVDAAVAAHGRETLIRGIPLERGINCIRCSSSKEQEGGQIDVQVVDQSCCIVNYRGAYRQVAVPFLWFVAYAGQPHTVDAAIVSPVGSDAVQVRTIERRVVRLGAADHKRHATLALIAPYGLAGDQFVTLMQSAHESEAPANFDLLSEKAKNDPLLADHPRVIYLAGLRASSGLGLRPPGFAAGATLPCNCR